MTCSEEEAARTRSSGVGALKAEFFDCIFSLIFNFLGYLQLS